MFVHNSTKKSQRNTKIKSLLAGAGALWWPHYRPHTQHVRTAVVELIAVWWTGYLPI